MSTQQLVTTAAEAFEGLPGYHNAEGPGDMTYGPGDRSYIGWAPGDDAMWVKKNDKGWWDSTLFFDSWEEFKGGFGGIDDLNVVVDFYFGISYDSDECIRCGGSGASPEANLLDRTFYSHSCRAGEVAWHDRITQEDVDALWESNRLRSHFRDDKPTPEEVNAWERGRGFGHDAINRWVMVKARCDRMGVAHLCGECDGKGHLRTSDDHLYLNLWMLHPRKGAARGIGVKRVPVEALDEVREWLRTNREISNRWWAWVDEPPAAPVESAAARERNLNVVEAREALQELIDRPSQHSAAYIRKIASRAQEMLHSLHTDVLGWEQEREAS